MKSLAKQIAFTIIALLSLLVLSSCFTSRFDRVFDSDSKIISGFRLPYRLHQEDFAQALGIKSERKYEKDGEEYLQKMFGLIRKFCSNPIEDSLRLWRRAVFNYLIGNTDNHIKNASLWKDLTEDNLVEELIKSGVSAKDTKYEQQYHDYWNPIMAEHQKKADAMK